MPKLPRTSAKAVLRTLEHMGFQQVRQRGSHVIMRRGSEGCAIPLHRELAVGTLAGALRQAKVPVEEFLEHMER